MQLGNYQQAIADYNRVLEEDPDMAEIYSNRALVYFQMGDRRSARADLDKAASLFEQQGNEEGHQAMTDAIAQLNL